MNFGSFRSRRPRLWRLILIVIALLIVIGLLVNRLPQSASLPELTPVLLQSWQATQTEFDVVVTGSEPEGIVAAVAAAQEGASVLLVTDAERLGGLFVSGMMNSLDLRTQPELYQRGLFEAWWNRVGRGHAFDVRRAEHAFEAMLAEAGVTVLTNAPSLKPRLEGGRLVGVQVGDTVIASQQLIDATPEADVAAAAGAPFSYGFSAIGLDARMVDTLVFRIDNVDWPTLQRGIRARGGKAYAEVSERAAWGHFSGYPARYQALEPGIRLRGLNLGLQEDGTVLVNALMIEGIDPFDPESRAEGKARATREAPRIIEYLRADVPGMENATFGGVAETLYIRETRHLDALCVLTVDDVLDNRVTEQAIAAGGYPLDVHPLTPYDTGFVFGVPEIYGVELCVTVPPQPEGLWVVGKAAGYDPIAHSSARVVPFGMAVAEAVGVAAAMAVRYGLTPAALALDDGRIATLRERLRERGAYLPRVQARDPVGPHQHPHYRAYRLMLSRGLAVGGYDNDPKLDERAAAISYVYLLANVSQRFWNDHAFARKLVDTYQLGSEPLTPELAKHITEFVACHLGRCLEATSWDTLRAHGLAPEGFAPAGQLTRGEVYALAAKLAPLGAEERLAEE